MPRCIRALSIEFGRFLNDEVGKAVGARGGKGGGAMGRLAGAELSFMNGRMAPNAFFGSEFSGQCLNCS